MKYFSLKEASKYLEEKGVMWSEGYLRNLCAMKKIESEKQFTSRVISEAELERIVFQKTHTAGDIK